MFKLQSLFAECPAGGSISYEITIPVENMSPDLSVTVDAPDGKKNEPEISGNVIKLTRHDGPGLWRFDVRLRSKANPDVLFDNHIIDVVILEETDEAVRVAVDKALNRISGSNKNEVAQALHKEMNGNEIPEVVRRLCFMKEEKNYWWSCFLLEWLIDKPKTRHFYHIIAEITSDIQCTSQNASIALCAKNILDRSVIKPQDKWIYFLRILTETPISINGTGYGWCSLAATSLSAQTPKDFQTIVLQVAEEILQSDPSKASDIAILFKNWNHIKGIPLLLAVLEMDLSHAPAVCSVIEACNYREATSFLREILSITTVGKGGSPIIRLLSNWGDEESIDIMLDKLERESNAPDMKIIVEGLKKFNNPSIKDRIKKIQANSSEEKAKYIKWCLIDEKK